MCSTPQKHPAAIVALAASGGTDTPPAGVMPMLVLVVKGRKRRAIKLGIVLAIRMARRRGMRVVVRGRRMAGWGGRGVWMWGGRFDSAKDEGLEVIQMNEIVKVIALRTVDRDAETIYTP
jgi:hypothetical protein